MVSSPSTSMRQLTHPAPRSSRFRHDGRRRRRSARPSRCPHRPARSGFPSPIRRPRSRRSTSSKPHGSTTATSGTWRRRPRHTGRRWSIDPDLVPGIVNLANIHYARDEMIEAQALYERAIRLEPHCFEAHFNLGNIHHDLGRFESALVCYHQAVALNPAYPDAHFYLAVTLEKIGAVRRSQAALEDLSGPGSGRGVGGAGEGVLGMRSRRAGSSDPAVNSCSRFVRASSACDGACRTRTPGTRSRA